MSRTVELKVSLKGISPPIWRKLLIEEDTTFYEFHHILQIVFGWENSHLYEFRFSIYKVGNPILLENPEVLHDKDVRVIDSFEQTGDKVIYEYDFGDYWIHEIVLSRVDLSNNGKLPYCKAGKRNAPPEDCGGVFGYQELIKAIKDTSHPQHAHYKSWLSGYNPEHFHVDQVNRSLENLHQYIVDYEIRLKE